MRRAPSCRCPIHVNPALLALAGCPRRGRHWPHDTGHPDLLGLSGGQAEEPSGDLLRESARAARVLGHRRRDGTQSSLAFPYPRRPWSSPASTA